MLNRYPGTLFANGSPAFGYVDSFDDGATSSYNGLLLRLSKRFSHGFSMDANYTWSHCIGDLSIGDSTGNAGQGLAIPNNRRYDRSNCQSNEIGGTFSADRRQIFNLTTVYQTPKFSNAWATRLFSDWQNRADLQLQIGLLDFGLPLHRRSVERRHRRTNARCRYCRIRCAPTLVRVAGSIRPPSSAPRRAR